MHEWLYTRLAVTTMTLDGHYRRQHFTLLQNLTLEQVQQLKTIFQPLLRDPISALVVSNTDLFIR